MLILQILIMIVIVIYLFLYIFWVYKTEKWREIEKSFFKHDKLIGIIMKWLQYWFICVSPWVWPKYIDNKTKTKNYIEKWINKNIFKK